MTAPARRTRPVAIGLLVAAMILAGVLSYFASSQPDGLEKVAGDQGISASERPHDGKDSPLADYQTAGLGDSWASGGIAGLLGVAVVGAAGSGLFMLLRPRRADGADAATPEH